MTAFDELEHIKSQLHECRNHEANLQIEVAQLRERVAQLTDNQRSIERAWDQERRELRSLRRRDELLIKTEAACERLGWVLHHISRYHAEDADAHWEAMAHRRGERSDHEHGEGASFDEALSELIGLLSQRAEDTA